MKRALSFCLLIFSVHSIGGAQPTPQVPTSISAYHAPGITDPELLSPKVAATYVSDHCFSSLEGKATLSVIVDSNGIPRNIYFINPIGNDLDVFALKHASEDRFKAATQDGKPIAVAASLEVELHTCLRDEKDGQNKSRMILHLAAEPRQQLLPPVDPPKQVVLVSGNGITPTPEEPNPLVYKVGGDVKPPHAFPPSPEEMRYARSLLDLGDYKVSVLVDRNGMPSSIRIIDSAQPGKEQVIARIMGVWRFKPAMLNGQPVPARIELGLKFTAYGR